MAAATHILFDFFGTLVTYSESRVDQGFVASHRLLAASGSQLDYDGFLREWLNTFQEFDANSEKDLAEFSMNDVCEEFLRRVLPTPPDAGVVVRFRDQYLEEWNTGVHYIPGVPLLLADLSARFTLGLVTNTHHAPLVDNHLRAMDVRKYFATVVTSVEHGKKKPSPCIFELALERSRGRADAALYVGDSYSADYLGALGAGMRALLIDPKCRQNVKQSHRLANVLETRGLLAG